MKQKNAHNDHKDNSFYGIPDEDKCFFILTTINTINSRLYNYILSLNIRKALIRTLLNHAKFWENPRHGSQWWTPDNALHPQL